jgi:hypothetical protein
MGLAGGLGTERGRLVESQRGLDGWGSVTSFGSGALVGVGDGPGPELPNARGAGEGAGTVLASGGGMGDTLAEGAAHGGSVTSAVNDAHSSHRSSQLRVNVMSIGSKPE